MANPPSRVTIVAYAPSSDGRWHFSYPNGDAPSTSASLQGSAIALASSGAPSLRTGSGFIAKSTGVASGIGVLSVTHIQPVSGASARVLARAVGALTTMTTPSAPTITLVKSGDQQATLSFLGPTSDGGSPILDYWFYNAADNSYLGISAGPTATLTGLANGAPYQFYMRARNAVGLGAPSGATGAYIMSGVPFAITIGTVIAGDGQLTIPYTLGSSNGSPITKVVLTTQAGQTIVVTASPAVLPVPNNVAYTVTGYAINANGNGPLSGKSNTVTPVSAVVVAPGIPGNLQITSQTQSTNQITWTPATPGSAPLAYYQIYRNGGAYTNTPPTTLNYTDPNAPNNQSATYGGGNPDPLVTSPNTTYVYVVSAVDVNGVEGPKQTAASLVMYAGGTKRFPGDFSYGLTVNYNDTSVPLQAGSSACITLTMTGSNGGFQPYTGAPMSGQWNANVSGLTSITVDVRPQDPGQTYNLSAMSRVVITGGDVFPFASVSLNDYGPAPVANQWNTYKIPLADLNIGYSTFTGSVGAPYGSFTANIDSGTVTYKTATLTCAGTISGPGVDNGAFITGGGLPAGCYVVAYGQKNSTGTFTITGPNVTSTMSVASTTLTAQRTDLYKLNFSNPNTASGKKWSLDNIVLYNGAAAVATRTAPSIVPNVVATAGDGIITVTFGTPSDDGGDSINGYGAKLNGTGTEYTLSGAVASSIIVPAPNGTPAYVVVYAYNDIGVGPSGTSNTVTPVAAVVAPVVGAPSIVLNVVATASDGAITVTFGTPTSNGGDSINGYTAKLNGTGTSVGITGATPAAISVPAPNGTAAFVTVHAYNDVGVGPDGKSNMVTPVGTAPPPTGGGTTTAQRKAYVVSYLKGLAGKGSLVGEHAEYYSSTSSASQSTAGITALKNNTGKAPAVMGLLLNTTELVGISSYSLLPSANATLFQQQTAANGLVHLNWYMPNPVSGKRQGDSSSGKYYNTTLSDSDFKSVITPGTAAYNRYQSYMASAVATLKSAPYNGVPCFWRPFIEISNGPGSNDTNSDGVNWYSYQQGFSDGTANFVAFWKMTYNYFIVNGVDWLIWVWNLNNYPQINDTQLWTGLDSYVDAVSTDPYPGAGNHTYVFSQAGFVSAMSYTYQTLANKNKIVLISEMGYKCSATGPVTGDNMLYLQAIKASCPKVVCGMYFDGTSDNININKNANTFMHDSYSITLDELPPKLLTGGV